MIIRKIKNLLHLFQGVLANAFFGFPSKKICVIGVTGTDGKTTTTHLIYHILTNFGIRASMISSVFAKIGSDKYETGLHTTTPNSFAIQRFIKKAVDNGDSYFILETTAHGIDQHRIWGIDFAISVLTNITHEHIVSHGHYDYFLTIDNYAKTKIKLINKSKIGVINLDDPITKKFLENKSFKVKLLTYSLKKKADYEWKKEYLFPNMIGEFQKYNILSAIAVCSYLGIPHEKIIQGIKSFQLPKGRFEIVIKKPIICVIDFAHTINGLENVLSTIKNYIAKDKQMIHVFGSAGERDYKKREKMGRTSAQWSDKIILTEEDYRRENPREICKQIEKGIKSLGFSYVKPQEFINKKNKNKIYTIIISRKKAIETSIKSALKGRVIVFTGKGHEKSLCRGNTEYPWDERKEIVNALKKCHIFYEK